MEHELYLFQVLSTEQQTSIIWALSLRKQHHDVIHSSRNLETAYCTTWHLWLKLQYKECLGVNLRIDSYSYWWKLKIQSSSWFFKVVTRNGDVMLLLILPHGLKVNIEAYIKCLKKIVLTWIERMAAERPYIWKQDSVPYHIRKRTQSLWENFCDAIIPYICLPNSPDCNLFDVLVVVESETNKSPHNTKDELKARIMAVFTNLSEETVRKTCRRFWSHLEAIVE